jgi:hypothetical protein
MARLTQVFTESRGQRAPRLPSARRPWQQLLSSAGVSTPLAQKRVPSLRASQRSSSARPAARASPMGNLGSWHYRRARQPRGDRPRPPGAACWTSLMTTVRMLAALFAGFGCLLAISSEVSAFRRRVAARLRMLSAFLSSFRCLLPVAGGIFSFVGYLAAGITVCACNVRISCFTLLPAACDVPDAKLSPFINIDWRRL